MDVPPSVSQTPIVLRERWAFPRIAVSLTFILVALVVPGTTALVLRPENPGEGYVALTLALLAAAWQLRRLATAGVRMDPDGIARIGRPTIPWADVRAVHWRTHKAVGRRGYADAYSLHWLEVTTPSGTTRLTRYPAKDEQADRFTRHLRDAGLAVPTPDWSRTPRPADS